MKPLHIGLLVAAAALGGAFFTMVMNNPEPAAQPVTTAEAPAPAPAEVPQAAPEPAEPAKPSPLPSAVPERRPSRSTAAPRPKPVETAQTRPPETVQPAPPAAQPAPAPPAPVKTEPEPEPKVFKPTEPPPAPPARKVTLTAGTLIPVRLVESLASDKMSAGDSFSATLDAPLVVDSLVIAERGSRVQGRVVNVEAAGRVRGVAAMGIELTSIKTSDGQTVRVQTDTFERQAEKEVAKDAAKVGVAAGIGAAIGAIAGGGKGAGIGAAVGGAAGTGGVMATRGKPVVIPSETKISFRLSQPVTVTERK